MRYTTLLRSALAAAPAAVLTCALSTAASAQIDWVTFTENSALRAFAPGDINSAGLNGDETDFMWADLDKNGWEDLVVVRKQPFTTTGKRSNVLLMNELGVLTNRTMDFAATSDVPGDVGFGELTNDRDVQIADVDQDGWLDVITATTLSQGFAKHISHPRIYMNLGEDASGDWLGLRHEDARIPQIFLVDAQGNPTSPTAPKFCSVAAGDVTGDGYPDLYFGDYDSGPGFGDVNNRLMINDGNGFFVDSLETRISKSDLLSAFGAASVIADMNGDGVNDVVKQTALSSPTHIAINYNNPANEGSFNIYHEVMDNQPYHVNVGELNNDGRLDLVVSSDSADRYRLNQGNDPLGRALWGTNFTYDIESGGDDGFASNNLIADLDMDGWNDVLIADVDVDSSFDAFGRRLHIYHNLGEPGDEGGFVDLVEHAGGHFTGVTGVTLTDLRGTHDIAVFDIDNDGDNDLVISRDGGTYTWESSVDPITCQEDRGNGGGGTELLSVCGTPLGTGGSAVAKLEGAGAFHAAILLVSLSDAVTPQPLFGGLELVNASFFKVFFTNGLGEKSFPITGGSGQNGVVTVYLQYLTQDLGTLVWGSSNVVQVELEE